MEAKLKIEFEVPIENVIRSTKRNLIIKLPKHGNPKIIGYMTIHGGDKLITARRLLVTARNKFKLGRELKDDF